MPNQIPLGRLLPSRRLPANRVHQLIYLAKQTRPVVDSTDFFAESFCTPTNISCRPRTDLEPHNGDGHECVAPLCSTAPVLPSVTYLTRVLGSSVPVRSRGPQSRARRCSCTASNFSSHRGVRSLLLSKRCLNLVPVFRGWQVHPDGKAGGRRRLWRRSRRISSEGSGTALGNSGETGDGPPHRSNDAGLRTRHPDLSCLGGCNCLSAQALFCSRRVRQLGQPRPSALAEVFPPSDHGISTVTVVASVVVKQARVKQCKLQDCGQTKMTQCSRLSRMCGPRKQHCAEAVKKRQCRTWKSRLAVRAAASRWPRWPRLPASRGRESEHRRSAKPVANQGCTSPHSRIAKAGTGTRLFLSIDRTSRT